jgi:GntR family transcriptional regulator
MLNFDSPIPLYHQLAIILTEKIRSGRYQPGQMIPSETVLARQFAIGRPTVRQAMDTLVKKGLILRKRGAGTFVRSVSPVVDLFSIAGTSQAFSARGITVETQLVTPLVCKTGDTDPDHPFAGRQAFFLSRLTRAGTTPVLVEDIWLDKTLFKGLEKINLENRSLAQVVAEHFGLVPETGDQQFSVSIPNPKKADLLELSPEKAVLLVKRTLNFPGAPGRVYSEIWCRTDTFAFSQTIQAAP